LVAATKDNVSAEPLKVFDAMMGANAKTVAVEGDGHGAGVLGDRSPEVWTTLSNWVAMRRGDIARPREEEPPTPTPSESVEPLVLPAGNTAPSAAGIMNIGHGREKPESPVGAGSAARGGH
jgi:hypothetical protein